MSNVKRRTWTIGLSVLASLVLLSPRSWAQEIYGIQYGSPETFAEFHGFINIEYLSFQKDDPEFDPHHFYFNSIAKIRENILVFAELEFEHGLEAATDLRLDRVLIDWGIVPGLTLRIGKFYTPFGVEIRHYQAPVRKLVSRPLFPREILFNEWLEVGINAYGTLGPRPLRVTYDVAITNGPKGITRADLQNRDTNSSKAYIGRVSVIPRLAKDVFLEVGGSFAYAKYDPASLLVVRHFGADATLRVMGLELEAEWMSRNGNDQVGPPFVRARGMGYYLQASYRIRPDLPLVHYIMPVIRYDRSDFPDRNPTTQDTARRRWTLGVNYSPYNHVRLKAEYQFVAENRSNLENNGVFLAAVVDF